jgi:hypothetical protein
MRSPERIPESVEFQAKILRAHLQHLTEQAVEFRWIAFPANVGPQQRSRGATSTIGLIHFNSH